jgi:hypothetical protein
MDDTTFTLDPTMAEDLINTALHDLAEAKPDRIPHHLGVFIGMFMVIKHCQNIPETTVEKYKDRAIGVCILKGIQSLNLET